MGKLLGLFILFLCSGCALTVDYREQNQDQKQQIERGDVDLQAVDMKNDTKYVKVDFRCFYPEKEEDVMARYVR